MQCVLLNGSFGLDRLTLSDVQEPAIDEHGILVSVKAASVIYVDLAVVEGAIRTGAHLPFIPDCDGEGEVVEVGSKVSDFQPGDRIATVHKSGWGGATDREERRSKKQP